MDPTDLREIQITHALFEVLLMQVYYQGKIEGLNLSERIWEETADKQHFERIFDVL